MTTLSVGHGVNALIRSSTVHPHIAALWTGHHQERVTGTAFICQRHGPIYDLGAKVTFTPSLERLFLFFRHVAFWVYDIVLFIPCNLMRERLSRITNLG